MRPPLLILFIFCLGLSSYSQDNIANTNINGTWKGKLVQNLGGCFPVYNIELQLQVAGSRITGVSYHYSDQTNFVKEEFEGSWDIPSKTAQIDELKVLIFQIPNDCIPCIKKYKLILHREGQDEQLRGSWEGTTMDKRTACPPGTIVLNRVTKADFKPEPKLPPALVNRKAELIKEIFVDTGNIKIDFYDNGQIDGDTISVYVNSMPTVSNKMLTAKPVSMHVRIDLKKTMQEVIMVGENMGSIPPNTALMIINAGDKRYQLYLKSDSTKNAMVRFIYQKPGTN
jgi:hypothetical protein